MAVTKAKSEKDVQKDEKAAVDGGGLTEVHRGASGGAAPEGYGAPGLVGGGSGGVENATVSNEGVATRTPEQEKKREEAAAKFKASVKKAGEMSPEDVAKAQDKIDAERNKKADEKPTVAGADATGLDNPNAVHSAKETEKAEHEIVKDESASADKKDNKKADKADKK